MDGDVEFLNSLYIESPKPLVLPEGSLEEHRERRRTQLDEVEDSDESGIPLSEDQREIAYSRELADIIKINIAFKTLQILGQVLRSFPGSLKAGLKSRITIACYTLGLRVLNVLVILARENLEALRQYFGDLIKEHRAVVSQNELERGTGEFVIWLMTGSAYGIIKRISKAAGSEELRETYKHVINSSGSNLAISVVDLSIKLDHFVAFPEHEVMELRDAVRKNRFAFGVLRQLLVDYLYLFKLAPDTKQRLSQWFQIQRVYVSRMGKKCKGLVFSRFLTAYDAVR